MTPYAFLWAPVAFFLRLTRKLWIRVALMALLALIVSFSSTLLSGLFSPEIKNKIEIGDVLPILTILATGMLAVSTFSLNVMVAAYRAAAAQATPRAHRILLEDTTTQTVLATFIGAFVYSLSAIILLRAGLHGEGAALTVMAATVFVVLLVIIAMIRWIDHLSDLGSMDATLRTIEAKARESLINSRKAPHLSASPLSDETIIPTEAMPLRANASGYLQFISVASIDAALPGPGAHVWITSRPGTFVLEGQIIGHTTGLDHDALTSVQEALSIGDERTFEQDATYALLVLSETASRALSPGINDPGTAIDVIGRQEKLLWHWAHATPPDAPPEFPQIFIKAPDPRTFVENAFAGVARDGAGMAEVVKRLLNALTALQDSPDPALAEAAKTLATRARAFADKALVLPEERSVAWID